MTTTTLCAEPCCCAGHECGTIFYCEDGVCTPIPPPTYFAVLAFDPAAPGCAPYWSRPENLGLNCPPIPPPPPPLVPLTRPNR